MTRHRTAVTAATERCAGCRMQRLLALMAIIWMIGTCYVAADDRVELLRVPRVNASGSFGVFWSCGSALEFSSCTMLPNVSCTAVTTVGTFNNSITAASVHYARAEVYMVYNQSEVRRLSLTSGELDILYEATLGRELLCIAVDWLNQELYLIQDRRFLRCNLNALSCAEVLAGRATDVREVAVDPNNGWIFWTAGNGSVWRDALPTAGAATVGNKTPPVLLAAAGSACPGRGFAVVSQPGFANLTFASGRACHSSQSLNITSFSVKRTNSASVAPSKIADVVQGFSTAVFTLATSGSSGLVCANGSTCMWIDPGGGNSSRRLVLVDLARNLTHFASLPTDGGADEAGVCIALTLWHRDLQFVPVPLMSPKNVEVLFTSVSAGVTWDPPAISSILIWPVGSRTIYDSVWRNWMYKVSIQASEVRAGSVLNGVALTLPERQVCLVPSRGSRRCRFDGLSSYWLYNISVTAYSYSGETSTVVRGSPLRDGSPVLIGATVGLAYSLLHFENGSVLAEGVAGSSSSYSASTATAMHQGVIKDLAVAGSTKLFVVLSNKTVLQTDRSLLLGMLKQPAVEGRATTVTAASAATPLGLDSSSLHFDGCTATPHAEAVTWDWISGSLYIATATGIVRLAAGCSGRAEPVVAELAGAIVVEPLVERLLLWITVDQRSLKYCKLGSSCRADDVTTIYTSPCGITEYGYCVPQVLSVTVDIDDRMLYWALRLPRDTKPFQVYAAALSQPTAYRELISDSKTSTPSLAAHGGKLLWIANGSRLMVRDSRGDAIGSYPLASPPPRTLWPLHNYSRWLLPGFVDIDTMHAATRPGQIDAASSRITVDGSATNFTIRWQYLNTSALVDVLYSVTISGTGISQSEVVYSTPAVNVVTDSAVPLSPLRVTITPFTHWVTGEPYTSDIAVPAAVPPVPSNLEAFFEYRTNSIIWLYWDQDYLPGAPVINTTIFITNLGYQSSSSSDSFVGTAFGSQRSYRFSSPGDGQEYSVKVVSCNAAGCSNFSTSITVSTQAGKLAPLPRVIAVQSSGYVLDGDFRFSDPTAIKNASRNDMPVLVAAFVSDAGVSPVWVDSTGCLHQKLAEAGHVESQIGCGLRNIGGAAIDSSRRRLYLLNDSAVLQVDPVAMENRTVYRSTTDNIRAISFDKDRRSLVLLMDRQKLIALDADSQTTQSVAGRLPVRRHVDAACNCTAASSFPVSYALTTSATDGTIVFYLENGTVFRADASVCNCWPIVRTSDVNVPGFLPDQISAGNDRLFVYSKFHGGLLSSDFWGSKLIALRNVSVQYIWPYSSLTSAAPAVDFVPVVDRLAPLNANEVRLVWHCSNEATCNVAVGTEREAFLLFWLIPSLPRQAVEVNSLKLSPGPYMVPHLRSATTYGMQIWVCDRNSCAHSAVYDVTTLHAPAEPLLVDSTNISLAFSWTAPPDGSVLSHYIRLDSTNGKLESRTPEVKTAANRQYTMSLHELKPATDYLARVVVVYKASSPREYLWPLSGLHVSTLCSPPANVTISKSQCGRMANSSCTVELTYADPSLIAKCQIRFNLSISCLSEDRDASVVLHSSSVEPAFVIPVADLPPADQRVRCIALALAVSSSVHGPWSGPVELPLKPVSPDNISENSNESIAVPLAACLSVVTGLALSAVAVYVCVCRRRQRKKSRWQANNRAEREDRRSPEGDPQNLPLVACRVAVPPVDMLVNEAYHTESVLHEPAAVVAPPSWGTVNTANRHAKLPKVDRRKLILLRPLGAGAFGEVYSGVTTLMNDDDQEENVPVAVKALRSDASDTDKSDFLKEAVLMSNFHHKNVVRLIGVCADADPIYIVIELMQEGDLLDFVRRKRPTREAAGQLSLHTLLHMAFDIASGCEYLESLHFVHRDLAARNCLVSSSGHPDCCPLVKIGDFGLARDVYRNDYYRKDGEAFLPVRWMSPESLVDGVFTNHSDVWSFGVLMWELFSLGMQPYTAKSNIEVLQYVRNAGTLDQPLRCPESMYRLMSQCWSYVPKERPSFMAVRCAVQQILSEIDQNVALVAAYDRCNGRLTSDQEFFSTSSAAEDVPLSARMVRQLSDVFDADAKPPPAAAADERVQYRNQNSVKGRLSRIFRRSANTSLLNRVNSQTDPDSRKSNVYVHSESVLSSDAVPARCLSSSRDSAFMEADESRQGNFSDFVLDSIATVQEAALPNQKTRTIATQHREDKEDAPATVVETVNYSLITPAAKQPNVSPASGDSSAVCRPAGVVAAGSLVADDRTPHDRGTSNLESKLHCDSTESPTGSHSADSHSTVNYSLVVALPPVPQQQLPPPPPQPSMLDEADDSCEYTAKVQLTGLSSSPDRANKKVALPVKKSIPNAYAYDLHKGGGTAEVTFAGTDSAVTAATMCEAAPALATRPVARGSSRAGSSLVTAATTGEAAPALATRPVARGSSRAGSSLVTAATTGEAAPALATRPVARGSSRAGSSRVAAATGHGIPPPIPPLPRDDMGLTAVDYSGDEPQFK